MDSSGCGGGGAPPISECCMCGDYGVPQELFTCSSCGFRSQHRYCSDLYPKAASYRLCNWCLKADGGKSNRKAVDSTGPSAAQVPPACAGVDKSMDSTISSSGSNEVGIKLQRCSFPSPHPNCPIKKQRSPETPSQKKTISEESLRRTRSEEMPNAARPRALGRGKVRRYKLLEEVSS